MILNNDKFLKQKLYWLTRICGQIVGSLFILLKTIEKRFEYNKVRDPQAPPIANNRV